MKRLQFWFVVLFSLATFPAFGQNTPQDKTAPSASIEAQASAPNMAEQDKQNLIHKCSDNFITQRHANPEAATNSCSCLFENFSPDQAKIVQSEFMKTLTDIEFLEYQDWSRQNSKIINKCRNLGCAGKESIYENCDFDACRQTLDDKDYDSAIKYCSRSNNIIAEAQAYLAKGSYDRAIAGFEKMYKLNPIYGNRYLAIAYHWVGRDAEALPLADKQIAKSNIDFQVLEVRGEIHENLGQRDAAIADYHKVVSMHLCDEDFYKAREHLIHLNANKDVSPLASVCDEGPFSAHDPRYLDEEHVIVQVCKPNKTVDFENVEIDLGAVPKEPDESRMITPASPDQGDTATVKKWKSDSESAALGEIILSFVRVIGPDHIKNRNFGGDSLSLLGNTMKGQPVYEGNTRIRQGDIIALAVRSSAEYPDEVNYWFELPEAVPHNSFTEWQEPVSQEGRAHQVKNIDTLVGLYEGNELKRYPVEYGGAPKMRFKIMSEGDYVASSRFWKREQIALNLENYRAFKVTGQKKKDSLFAPKLTEVIPSCETAEENAH